MPLSDAALRAAKPRDADYKLSDGGGLHVLIRKNGSKLWRLKYRFGGREKLLSFGAYPGVGLADARREREVAKTNLKNGVDPGAKVLESGVPDDQTFGAVARAWFAIKEEAVVGDYATKIWSRVEKDVLPFVYVDPKTGKTYPPLSDWDVASIEPPMLLAAFRKIEERGAIEMAKRVKNHVSEICRFAIAEGRASRDPTADLRGALRKPTRVRHRAALKFDELPTFFARLRAYDGTEPLTKLALRLVVLTAARRKELLYAEMSEFENLDGADPLWRVPLERMKMKRPHIVPLSPQAVDVIRQIKALGLSDRFLLPAARAGYSDSVMSGNTMIYALYRLGYHQRATVHGFRGTFSTAANESGLFDKDWIEKQLAHDDRDAVRSAYNAAEYLAHRRRLMDWWGAQVEQQEALSQLLG